MLFQTIVKVVMMFIDVINFCILFLYHSFMENDPKRGRIETPRLEILRTQLLLVPLGWIRLEGLSRNLVHNSYPSPPSLFYIEKYVKENTISYIKNPFLSHNHAYELYSTWS